MDTIWQIQLLNGLRATCGDRAVSRFRTRKTAALLAYLAFTHPRSHPREELIERHWPECDPALGRRSLRTALSSLRQQLEPPDIPPGGVIRADRAEVGLHPNAVITDVARFQAALRAAEEAREPEERARWLALAVEAYGGSLLPGYHEDWVVSARPWLATRYQGALSQLTDEREAAGDLDRALDYARQLVAVDPLEEESHRTLIRLLAAAGQPGAAISQYRELERLLQRDLGAVPDALTLALVRQLDRRLEPDPDCSRPVSSSRELAAAPPETGNASCHSPGALTPAPPSPEPAGGSLPLGSAFYIDRPVDAEFRAAVARRDSIVLVKGAGQMGKSSLLARGLQQARQAGAQVVLTDFQKLSSADLESSEALVFTLAEWLAAQLEPEASLRDVWNPRCGPNLNFELYLRRWLLPPAPASLVWGMDAIDRLFPCLVGSELFGLFRAWHNERSFDPAAPWSRLTLAMAYATEAHLFIADLNRSPFNVGTRVTLGDLTREQVAELNRRCGSPLRGEGELDRFFRLLSGHPYLTQRGLRELARREATLSALEDPAAAGTGSFSDHLHRLRASVEQDPALVEAVQAVLRGRHCLDEERFFRLRSAGVLAGDTRESARLRCPLYASHLARHWLEAKT